LKSNHQAQSGRYSAKVVDMASQFKAKFVKKTNTMWKISSSCTR